MALFKGILSALIFLVIFLVVGIMLLGGVSIPANAQSYGDRIPAGDLNRLTKCVIICKKYRMCVLQEGLAREDGDLEEAARFHELGNQKFIQFYRTCNGVGDREDFLWVGEHWYCPDPEGPYASLYYGIRCR